MKTKARDLTVIADEVRSRIETVGDIIAIGGLLLEAKLQFRHGGFLPWVESEFDFSIRTAQNYMRAHKFATKNATVADLQLTPSALYALAEGQRYFSEETSRCRCVEYTADEIALVLKEAAEQRVTGDRAVEIIEADRLRKADAAKTEAAEQEPKDSEAQQQEAEAAAAQAAEAEATLDAGSELPPPEPSESQASPLDKAILTTFEEAIASLRSVMTKHASDFRSSYFTAAQLQTIAGFLQQVAVAKGAAVA
jgi:Protein of unknown function (DUF3102)